MRPVTDCRRLINRNTEVISGDAFKSNRPGAWWNLAKDKPRGQWYELPRQTETQTAKKAKPVNFWDWLGGTF